MAKTTEELMKPRYKVIADYPNSPFDVGKVLEIITTEFGEAIHEWYEAEGRERMYQTKMNEYPHIFRKLQWWEYRKKEDMPEYIRLNQITVYRVRKHDSKKESFISDDNGYSYDYSISDPATESDYLQSQQKNKV